MFDKVIALLEEQAKNLEKKRKEAAGKFRCYGGTLSGFEPNCDNQLSAISYYTDLIFEIESAVDILKQVGTDEEEEVK